VLFLKAVLSVIFSDFVENRAIFQEQQKNVKFCKNLKIAKNFFCFASVNLLWSRKPNNTICAVCWLQKAKNWNVYIVKGKSQKWFFSKFSLDNRDIKL
jgi:hypothetical protein